MRHKLFPQYKYAALQKQAFEFGCVDASQGPTSRRGSHVYEINNWPWNFGRPQPRVGRLSIAKKKMIRRQPRSETSLRAWETRKAAGKLQVAADSEEI